MVKCAKKAYEEFPTVVNKLKESGLKYKNNMLEYARMDNKFAKCKMGIGESSNLAQLAMTYYWNDTNNKELYDSFIILAVLAQVIIDGCKREYEVDALEEIERIKRLPSMQRVFEEVDENGNVKKVKKDFPLFMKYTKEIKFTENKKPRDEKNIKKDKEKLENRIDKKLECPMNWLQECLDDIKPFERGNFIDTKEFFIKMDGEGHVKQMSKIRKLIEEYDSYIRMNKINNVDDDDEIKNKTNILLEQLSKIKIGNIVTINRLIETCLNLNVKTTKKTPNSTNTKISLKMLNMLYKMNKDKFLINFK